MVKREDWPAGPWDDEPDELDWIDTATGLRCHAQRNTLMGIWCAYVAVPPKHPWHGVQYDDIGDANVHGGLTFADALPDDKSWWIGFDCGHAWDVVPFMAGRVSLSGNCVYRTLDFVQRECGRLAAQVRDAAG